MTPDLPFWTRLLIRIAVEAACVVGAADVVFRIGLLESLRPNVSNIGYPPSRGS